MNDREVIVDELHERLGVADEGGGILRPRVGGVADAALRVLRIYSMK